MCLALAAVDSVVATSYPLGVSTRRVDKLVEQLGIKNISQSQVSQMAKILDEQVEAFRTRALDAGPYAFVWLAALTQKVREGGRIINVRCLVATGVNADGPSGAHPGRIYRMRNVTTPMGSSPGRSGW